MNLFQRRAIDDERERKHPITRSLRLSIACGGRYLRPPHSPDRLLLFLPNPRDYLLTALLSVIERYLGTHLRK
jgi:hypothetical protein